MKTGVELIAAERQRQISVEGWTPEHDDEHTNGEIAGAAACYAVSKEVRYLNVGVSWMEVWPPEWDFKPKNRLADLVRAGALIAAEIDRLQRAAHHTETGAGT